MQETTDLASGVKQGVHSGFETQDRRHQKTQIGVPVAPRKGLMALKIMKKENFIIPYDMSNYTSISSKSLTEFSDKQECIPVGCLPSAAVAVLGGCLPRSVCLRLSAQRGVCPGGACLGGVCPGSCMPRAGRLPKGVSALGCTPPPMDRMTDACENITFSHSAITVGDGKYSAEVK